MAKGVADGELPRRTLVLNRMANVVRGRIVLTIASFRRELRFGGKFGPDKSI